MHSYIYGNSDPVNNIDPNGLISISNILAGFILSGLVLSAAIPATSTIVRGGDFEDGVNAALEGYINHVNCLIKGGYDKEDVSPAPLITSGAISVSPYVFGSFGVSKAWVTRWPSPIVKILKPALALKPGAAGTTNLVRIASVLSLKFFGSNDLTSRGLLGIANSIKGYIRRRGFQYWTGQGLKGTSSIGLQVLLTYGAVRTSQCLGSQLAKELYDIY